MKDYGILGTIAYIILLVGGINWGLIGLFQLNIVHGIFGDSLLARLVYIIVGAAAGYLIYMQYFKKKPV